MLALKEASYLNEFHHVFGRVHHKTASDNVRQPLEIAGICTISLWNCSDKRQYFNCMLQFKINRNDALQRDETVLKRLNECAVAKKKTDLSDGAIDMLQRPSNALSFN